MRPKRGPGEKDRWEGGTAGGSFVGGTKQLITEYGGPSGPQPILSPLAWIYQAPVTLWFPFSICFDFPQQAHHRLNGDRLSMQINGKFTRFALRLDFVLAARERRGLINFLQTAFSLAAPRRTIWGGFQQWTKEIYLFKDHWQSSQTLKHKKTLASHVVGPHRQMPKCGTGSI